MTVAEHIERAGVLLGAAAPGGTRIILFGSHARGDAEPGSDLDLLVIEPRVEDRVRESVRLRDALDELRMPIDVIVVDEGRVEEWGGVPGTMLHAALSEGRLLVET